MTLTEALHYRSCRKRPTNDWMRTHYSHFQPTNEDEKLRRKVRDGKRVHKNKQKREFF